MHWSETRELFNRTTGDSEKWWRLTSLRSMLELKGRDILADVEHNPNDGFNLIVLEAVDEALFSRRICEESYLLSP